MLNDQFSIPTMPSQDKDPAHLRFTPEREAGPYWGIKAVESRIYSYRAAAMAIQAKPRKWLRGLVTAPAHQPTLGDFIEQESYIGGALFGEGHAFWLDIPSGSADDPNQVSDWYHMQPNLADPKNPTVLRFQTTAQRIHKLYDGREYEPSVQDLEVFVRAVEAYSQAVLPLYPLDQAIDDLNHDSDSLTFSAAP